MEVFYNHDLERLILAHCKYHPWLHKSLALHAVIFYLYLFIFFSTMKLRTISLYTSISNHACRSAVVQVLVQARPAHYRPKPRVRASSTYVVAPYGRMLCAMLASWHCPRVNGQTLVNPTHSLLMGPSGSGCHGDGGGLWLLRGDEEKGRGHKWAKVTSQIEVSGVSWQCIWLFFSFLFFLFFCEAQKTATVLKRWSATYWSALSDRKWCCKKQT